MTENETPGAQPGMLMSIGAVAAHNLAQTLGLDEKAVPAIETAIKTEIDAMSQHFTLAYAEIQAQHEAAELTAKMDYGQALADATDAYKAGAAKLQAQVDHICSTYNYVEKNLPRVIAVIIGTLTLGMILGHLI